MISFFQKKNTNSFITELLFIIFSLIFIGMISEELKTQRFYSTEDLSTSKTVFVNSNEFFHANLELKTNNLLSLHIPYRSSVSLNSSNFSIRSKDEVPIVISIRERENNNYILQLNFPDYISNFNDFEILCDYNIEYLLDDDGVLQNKQFGFPKKFIIGIQVLLILFTSIFFAIINFVFSRVNKPWVKYLICAILLEFGMMVIMPAFMTQDERVHYDSTYNLSNIILGKGSYNQNGGLLMRYCDNYVYPEEYSDNPAFTRSITNVLKLDQCKKYYPLAVKGLLSNNIDNKVIKTFGENTGPKKIIFYIPQAIGICMARLLNLNQYFVYYFGCLFSILFTSLIYFFILKNIKCENIICYFIALMPMVLQQSSHYTYDGLIFAAGFGFCVFFIYYDLYKDRKHFFLSLVFAIFLIFARFPLYLPVLLLYLVILSDNSRKLALKVLSIVVLGFLGFYIFKHKYSPSFTQYTLNETGETYFHVTCMGLLRNPIHSFTSIIYTIFSSFGYFVEGGFGTQLCDTSVYILSILKLIALVIFVLCILNNSTSNLNCKTKKMCIISSFFIILLAFLGMASGFYTNELTSIYILGIHGRYFVPIAILLLYPLKSSKFNFSLSYIDFNIILKSIIFFDYLVILNLFYLFIS